MKLVVTGSTGTVGQPFVQTLRAAGHAVTPWDRAAVSPEDRAAGERFLDAEAPDWVCHLAMGAEDWAEAMAGWCRDRGRRLLFVSTAMVFDASQPGPYLPDHARDPRDDYGRYKARCEDRVRAALPEALVARIGWQIGTGRGGNQMLEALHGMVEADGHVGASEAWVPATSFLEDTGAAFLSLMEAGAEGVHHLDSNAESAWTFDRVVRALAARHGDPGWEIRVHRDYVHDQRLLDERVEMPSLAERLGEA